MSEHHADDDYNVHPHISTTKGNLVVLGALLFLTGATLAAYLVRLGDLNLTVAIAIATVKASLVCTFFMHMKYDKSFNVIFFLGSIFFLVLFFGYTANDLLHRAELSPDWGSNRNPLTGEMAPGLDGRVASAEGELAPIPEVEEGEGEGHGEEH